MGVRRRWLVALTIVTRWSYSSRDPLVPAPRPVMLKPDPWSQRWMRPPGETANGSKESYGRPQDGSTPPMNGGASATARPSPSVRPSTSARTTSPLPRTPGVALNGVARRPRPSSSCCATSRTARRSRTSARTATSLRKASCPATPSRGSRWPPTYPAAAVGWPTGTASRARFAQHAINADEVAREVAEVRAVPGSPQRPGCGRQPRTGPTQPACSIPTSRASPTCPMPSTGRSPVIHGRCPKSATNSTTTAGRPRWPTTLPRRSRTGR